MTVAKGQDRLDRLENLAEEMFAGIAQLRESQAKTDEQMRRTDAKLDRIGKQLGDLGLVQGEVAEDLFFRNLRGIFRKTKIDLKKVKRNFKRKGEAEQRARLEAEGVAFTASGKVARSARRGTR